MNCLIKAATIVDQRSTEHHLKKRDILIEGGTIKKIGRSLENQKRYKEIRLKNLHVSPGWVDPSVCFGEPGHEERETISNGLKVAARSGFTDIILNPNSYPVPDSSGDIVYLKEASRNSVTRLHPLGALTVRSEGKDLAELFDMHKAGAVGFYDFKHSIQNPNVLKLALLYTQSFEGLVCTFPLDVELAGKGTVHEAETALRLGLKGIPDLAEVLQVSRDLAILEYTGGRLHIPLVSTAGSVDKISLAKKSGLDVSCGVAIHNLFFTDEALHDFDTDKKVLPPLRGKKDQTMLRKAVEKGSIDFVTSDHTPLTIEEKRVEFDNAEFGTIALESMFGILNQIFDLETSIDVLTRARDRFGLETIQIEEDAPACITLFDPEHTYRISAGTRLSSSKNAIFKDQELKGFVYGIIVGNRMELSE